MAYRLRIVSGVFIAMLNGLLGLAHLERGDWELGLMGLGMFLIIASAVVAVLERQR